MNELQFIREQILSLKPGQRVMINDLLVERARLSMGLDQVHGNALDHIFSGIAGSAYEYSYRQNVETGYWQVDRLARPLEDGRRTFVDFDRRYRFNFDGYFYTLKP